MDDGVESRRDFIDTNALRAEPMISTSPLRYPGGKARFSEFIWQSIELSDAEPEVFVEPFCGGAGAAIALLEAEKVERIALNDVDPLVASFWRVVFGKSKSTRHDINWLMQMVESAEMSVDEWRRQKVLTPASEREAAWKCLYLNRTSFNGILHKAGPIGGWEQKNRSLDVRFNAEKLVKKLLALYERRDQVERVDCINWRKFCSYYRQSRIAYLYLDPPYYHRAEQLYGFLFSDDVHREMRDYLINLETPWILSYDDAKEVRKLYSRVRGIYGRVIDQTYSTHPMGGSSFVGRELFFSNRELPRAKQSASRAPHVGLSVLGSLKTHTPAFSGPTRKQISRMTGKTP